MKLTESRLRSIIREELKEAKLGVGKPIGENPEFTVNVTDPRKAAQALDRAGIDYESTYDTSGGFGRVSFMNRRNYKEAKRELKQQGLIFRM